MCRQSSMDRWSFRGSSLGIRDGSLVFGIFADIMHGDEIYGGLGLWIRFLATYIHLYFVVSFQAMEGAI